MKRGRAWISIAISISLASALSACGGSSKASEPAPAKSKYRAYPADSDDDAHDDRLAVVSSRGVLEPEQVHAGMSPHSDELTSCYLSRVAGRRWLGGNLVLRWAVDAEGKILEVHVAESDLGAWPVERCLLEVARKMTFEAPRGGPTDFTVPLGFASVKRAAVLGEEQSAQAVGEQLAQLDTCTTAELAAPPRLSITLYASRRGVLSVGFATAEAAGLADAWAECAEKLALAWRIPLPPAEGKVAPLKLTLAYAPAL